MRVIAALAWLLLLASIAYAVEYSCKAEGGFSVEIGVMSSEYLERLQPEVRIEETPSGTWISRCTIPPFAEKKSCDRWKIDKVAEDRHIGAKKYYDFRGQYNVQLFRSLQFIEDVGRGFFYYGACTLVRP